MSRAGERLRRVLCSAVALLLSAVFAIAMVVVPVRVLAASGAGGGSGNVGGGGSDGRNGSGIWAGVSYYWGEWVGSRSSCTWSEFVGNTHLDTVGDAQPPSNPLPGVRYLLYVKVCPAGYRFVWVPQLPPQAIDHANQSLLSRWLPRPALRIAPPSGRVVVKVPMWFWTDATVWKPVSVTAWIPTPEGPVWVTTTATPVSMEFRPGDGVWGTGSVRCFGPGVPWLGLLEDGLRSPLGCDYTYGHSSVRAVGGAAFPARLTIDWRVTWRSSTGATGTGGTLHTSAKAGVTVREVEGLGIP